MTAGDKAAADEWLWRRDAAGTSLNHHWCALRPIAAILSNKIDRLTCVLIVVSTRWFHRHRSRLSASTEPYIHPLFSFLAFPQLPDRPPLVPNRDPVQLARMGGEVLNQ
jgi:hypothetical protein